jgi:hypothetical protein
MEVMRMLFRINEIQFGNCKLGPSMVACRKDVGKNSNYLYTLE